MIRLRLFIMIWGLLAGGLNVARAASLDLLADPGAWSKSSYANALPVDWVAVPQGIAIHVVTDGGSEDFPTLGLTLGDTDLRGYEKLHYRLRVSSPTPGVTRKDLGFAFYDSNYRYTNLDEHHAINQFLWLEPPVNQWLEGDLSLSGLQRSAMGWLSIVPYEMTPGQPHEFTLEIAELTLLGAESNEVAFDGELFAASAFSATPAAMARQLTGADNLQLGLTASGQVAGLATGSSAWFGQGSGRLSGLLVGDIAAGTPPVAVGGTVALQGDGALLQVGQPAGQDLRVEATYQATHEGLTISGTLADLRGVDRAVTLYFALPLPEVGWRWDGDLRPAEAAAQTAPPYTEETSQETGMMWGHYGRMSHYPLGTMSNPALGAGLALGVRMDQPAVHRIAWNPALKTFYLALDFGLAHVTRAKGGDLATAPFQVLLFRTATQQPLRSALDAYYRNFPQFFAKRLQREGGWHVWGQVDTDTNALAAGFALDWGAGSPEQALWDNQNNVAALAYLEAHTYHQTFGDQATAPSPAAALERVTQSAAGNTAVLAQWETLGYAVSGAAQTIAAGLTVWTSRGHTMREFLQQLCAGATAAVMQDAAADPYISTGSYAWIGESNNAGILTCNLDPDIPGGRGAYNLDVALELSQAGYAGGGASHCDGFALDVFTSPARLADYNRAHFTYSDLPLCFSAVERRPVVPAWYSQLEWLRALHERYPDQLVMANVGGGSAATLVYGAPYLDVLGAESSAFIEPWAMRALMRAKTLTTLPYSARPTWEVDAQLLLGEFPGWGSNKATMAQSAVIRREIATAGWQPVTGAVASAARVRIERYGAAGGRQYLVFHNAGDASSACTVTIDGDALRVQSLATASVRFNRGGSWTATGDYSATMNLGARGTLCLELAPRAVPYSAVRDYVFYE